MGRKKRFWACVCLVPIIICLSYLLCVYSVYERSARIYDEQGSLLQRRLDPSAKVNHYDVLRNHTVDLVGHHRTRKTRNEFGYKISGSLVVFNDGMSDEGDSSLRGFKTDVDRTEDRKKKKKKLKFKKLLENKCKLNKTACLDLKYLEEHEKKSLLERQLIFLDGNRNTFWNSSFKNGTEWTAYADKGFTIVGKQGSLIQRLPHVLIIGAKKAGTRALLEFLRLHPSVTAAGAELHFFDRFYYRGLAWYRSNLPMSLEGQLTVEKTPAYFVDRDVPVRVKKFLPTVKLLLVVRDPVVRAVSDYTQSVSKNEQKRKFWDLALKNATSGLVNVAWSPVRGGLYARHYQRWRKYFPSSSIHVVSGEGLVCDPAGEMASVQDFLNLERVINDRHFYFNATKGFPCLVKSEKNGKPHCLGYSKGRPHPDVDKDALDILRDFYRPFNAKFYKMVGRNFGWP